MTIKNMTIKNQLIVSFSILVIVVLFTAMTALTALGRAASDFSNFIDGVQARADAVEVTRSAVGRRAIAVRNLVLVSSADDFAIEKASAIHAHEEVQLHLANLNRLIESGQNVPEQDKTFAAQINRIEKDYAPIAIAILGEVVDGKKAQAISDIDVKCRPLLAALMKSADDYYIYASERKKELAKHYFERYYEQRNLLIGIGLVAIMAAIGLAFLAIRAITSPLRVAIDIADTVARGDLRSTIQVDSDNETGRLLKALGVMNHRLTATVGSVRDSSVGIASASRQIAAGNADLSRRTEQQAASLQETAASMEELTSSAQQNTDNAKKASSLAVLASQAAEQGGVIVGRVVDSMQGISNSSSEIASITSVIEGIAFQTNILALNAAVEAARAGENGRGFAVVATEVRSLAQRSSNAAKEIKELLIRSSRQVGEGVTHAREAGNIVGQIVESVNTVTSLTGEIALASQEQSSGIAQINHAIVQMDEVTQQNAALVEQAAAASQALQHQGDHLIEAVAVFQLS